MKERQVLDISDLSSHGLGAVRLSWWGTAAYMLIEGTAFGLSIAMYLYLMSLAPRWPLGAGPPNLKPGTFLTVMLIVSLLPNVLLLRWARRKRLFLVRVGLIVMSAVGIAATVVRFFEFPALGVSWDANAYGSVLWLMLGLHTTHLITDLVDTIVLTVLMFTRHADSARRYGDVEDNAMYWNFVVIAWIPLYLCIYLLPRW